MTQRRRYKNLKSFIPFILIALKLSMKNKTKCLTLCNLPLQTVFADACEIDQIASHQRASHPQNPNS